MTDKWEALPLTHVLSHVFPVAWSSFPLLLSYNGLNHSTPQEEQPHPCHFISQGSLELCASVIASPDVSVSWD